MATGIADSLSSSLGLSSGINVSQLVSDLTANAFDPKQTALDTRVTTNNARISALASAKSALSTFSSALTELLKSSAYKGQPVSNDTSVVAVSALTGGTPQGLPAQIEVKQLAQGQVLQSASLGAADAVAGAGTLTLAVGGKSYDVTLTAPANTLADLATAINGANAGVSASIVTDQSGARLVLKGSPGADNAFTLTAGTGADADLQRFTFDSTSGSMARSQTAQNAQIAIDGVDMEFGSNEITTAIPYLRIDLNSAAPGKTVTIATDQPTATMNDLVQEIVSAYNNLKQALNAATTGGSGTSGLMTADSGMREMSRRLAALASTPLAASGPYRTLNDLGISTNRDGTLSLDAARLAKALADDPAAVTQMLNPTVQSADNPGVAGALKGITDYLNGTDGPLASSEATYAKLQKSLQDQLDALDDKRAAYGEQMTRVYSNMQTRLLQFKATQSYLEQQIAAWNKSSD